LIIWTPPPPNNDHKVEVIDPNNSRTWKVIKGKKPLRELLLNMIEKMDQPRRAGARLHHRL